MELQIIEEGFWARDFIVGGQGAGLILSVTDRAKTITTRNPRDGMPVRCIRK